MDKDLSDLYRDFLWDLYVASHMQRFFELSMLADRIAPLLRGNYHLDSETRDVIGLDGHVAQFESWLKRNPAQTQHGR